MAGPMTIMVDLDGVICTEEKTFERGLAQPIEGAREALQALRAAGHTIIVYTARGWPEYRLTREWLDRHGMAYDAIHMGKPVAHLWIDDRALPFNNWKDALAQIARR
jgi:uncharacterized HAD superfamily protein